MNRLLEFSKSQRGRFQERSDQYCAQAFGQVFRYRRFVQLCKDKQDVASASFRAYQERLHENRPEGIAAMTDEDLAAYEAMFGALEESQFYIESFYINAKILLNKTALAIQYYFGKRRGPELRSHHRLIETLDAYANEKDLTTPTEALTLGARLYDDVCVFRDKRIEHHESPRTVRGFGYRNDGGPVWIMDVAAYPNEKGQQIESRDLGDLLAEIDAYLDAIADWIGANQNKTALPLTGAAKA